MSISTTTGSATGTINLYFCCNCSTFYELIIQEAVDTRACTRDRPDHQVVIWNLSAINKLFKPYLVSTGMFWRPFTKWIEWSQCTKAQQRNVPGNKTTKLHTIFPSVSQHWLINSQLIKTNLWKMRTFIYFNFMKHFLNKFKNCTTGDGCNLRKHRLHSIKLIKLKQRLYKTSVNTQILFNLI